MLTNKAKYGLKALLYLGSHTDRDNILLVEIADAQNIPRKFLHAILRELRNAGYVTSKKGPGGGYALARNVMDARIGDMVRALDGPLAPIACASRNFYQPCNDCRDVATCRVRLAMLKVRDAIAEVLDTMSLRDLVALRPEPGTDLELALTGRQPATPAGV
jgi:Rrf2 family protein